MVLAPAGAVDQHIDSIPDGADSPAPDKIIMFLEEDNRFLNSEIEEDGAIKMGVVNVVW